MEMSLKECDELRTEWTSWCASWDLIQYCPSGRWLFCSHYMGTSTLLCLARERGHYWTSTLMAIDEVTKIVVTEMLLIESNNHIAWCWVHSTICQRWGIEASGYINQAIPSLSFLIAARTSRLLVSWWCDIMLAQCNDKRTDWPKLNGQYGIRKFMNRLAFFEIIVRWHCRFLWICSVFASSISGVMLVSDWYVRRLILLTGEVCWCRKAHHQVYRIMLKVFIEVIQTVSWWIYSMISQNPADGAL